MGGSSKPKDLTPEEFERLRGPLAHQLKNVMTGGLPQPGIGLTTPASITGGETESLARLRELTAGASPEFLAALQTLTQQAGGTQNPFATAAGLGGGEAFGLGELARLGFGGDTALGAAGGAVESQAGGVVNPLAGRTAGTSGAESDLLARIFGGQDLTGLQTAGRDQLGRTISGEFLDPASNPFLRDAIDAATRPIIEQFGDDRLNLRSRFTSAGQFVQPEASSPFDVAEARLKGGVASALGDVGTRISFENFNRERGRQLDATGFAETLPGADLGRQIASLEALGLPRELLDTAFQREAGGIDDALIRQLQAAGLAPGVSGQGFSQALQATEALGLPRQIEQAGLDRGAAAFESEEQRAQSAATAIPGLERAQIDDILTNLRAQALPRLIEELGIERGLAAFQQQQQSILAALGLASQVTSPTVAGGQQKNTGIGQGLGTIAGGVIGTYFGGPGGGAIGASAGGAIGGAVI